ncbi:hypothetical protein THRCLA_22460 [Thraustotheca clavata]|uniref:Uncharacterized protein n=1 Tax=Thraustotheca clavata TaxID=74557 RepID=A0A1V9Z0D4_9STRA|nr:hypothetical protein THRCLA_22460 [Thraustotheca clavata]
MNPIDLRFSDAIAKGDLDAIVSFLEAGDVDVNVPDRDGDIALHTAAKKNHLNAVELLLSYGASINAVDEEGWTALQEAVLNGNEDIVRVLLKHGADKTIRNQDGQLALDIAVQHGHAPLVFLLCEGHSIQYGFY